MYLVIDLLHHSVLNKDSARSFIVFSRNLGPCTSCKRKTFTLMEVILYSLESSHATSGKLFHFTRHSGQTEFLQV